MSGPTSTPKPTEQRPSTGSSKCWLTSSTLFRADLRHDIIITAVKQITYDCEEILADRYKKRLRLSRPNAPRDGEVQ